MAEVIFIVKHWSKIFKIVVILIDPRLYKIWIFLLNHFREKESEMRGEWDDRQVKTKCISHTRALCNQFEWKFRGLFPMIFFFLVGSVLSIENGFNVEEIKKKYYRFNHNELDIILICFCLTAKISQNRFFVFVGVATAAMAAAAAVAVEKWSERVFPSFVFWSLYLLSPPIRSVSFILILLLLLLGDRRAIKRS